MGAGLQQNLGKSWGPQTWKQMTTSSPNKVFTNAVEISIRKLDKDNKRKAKDQVKSRRRKSKYVKLQDTPAARKAYNRYDGSIAAPEEYIEDIPQENLDRLMSSFYQNEVMISKEQAKYIEQQTRNQADSSEWKSERKKENYSIKGRWYM